MSTDYLFASILTRQAVAANNRGDSIGNTTTLQKVFIDDDEHTSVSAEAIRFGIRLRFQFDDIKTNRTYDVATQSLRYEDESRSYWSPILGGMIDDDIMGFMDANAAKNEREDEDAPVDAPVGAAPETEGKAKGKAKRVPKMKNPGTVTKRASPLSVTRAVSIRPYRGEVSFNCVSGDKGAAKSNNSGAKALSLYGTEMHTTEYQFSLGLNLGDVITKSTIAAVIDAIVDPPQIAGNHARFAYDFSPHSVVFRVTKRHSSRIQNCFSHDEDSHGVTISRLVDLVKSGDVPAAELILGGAHVDHEDGRTLEALGVFVTRSVDKAAQEAKNRIAALGVAYKHVATAV